MPSKKLPPKKSKKPTKSSVKRKRASADKPLTQMEELFAEHKLNGLNGVQAARAAGYKGNDNVLAVTASRNLRKAKIASHVRARVEGVAATADEVLALLGDHLRADLADFQDCFNEDGILDLAKAQGLGVSRLVRKMKSHTRTIEQGEGKPPIRETTVEIEIHNSQEAAAKLIPVLGLKQQSRPNDEELEHNRQMALQLNAEVARLVNAGWSEDEARKIVLDASPEAEQWLQ